MTTEAKVLSAETIREAIAMIRDKKERHILLIKGCPTGDGGNVPVNTLDLCNTIDALTRRLEATEQIATDDNWSGGFATGRTRRMLRELVGAELARMKEEEDDD